MPEKLKLARFCLNVEGLLFWATSVLFLFIFIYRVKMSNSARLLMLSVVELTPGANSLIVSFVFAGLGLASFFAAAGIRRKKSWAKVIGLIIGFLCLPIFPVGTFPGVFIISGLWDRQTSLWFKPDSEQ